MTLNKKRVGREIKRLRLAHNLTQAELATTLSLHHTYISHLETGMRAPGRDVLVGIAAAFGVTTDELLNPRRA